MLARRPSLERALHDAEFVRQYEPFVRGIAKHTTLQLEIEGDLEDLVAAGFEGLLEARKRFDPARGVAFKSFAYYRVRGAVIDAVRQNAYLPRRAYARLKAAEALDIEGEQSVEQRAAGQAGGASASARDVEVNLRAIDGILGRVAAAYATAAGSEDDPQTEPSDPERALLVRERKDRVRRALDSLPEPERTLLQGHYLQDRRFDEIAAELGLSKSWASRLHTRALALMREALEGGA
jgi:RNA polymerase sigma factor for flagellar operon FliA